MMRPFGVRFQARESSDKPILKAFCRVTPSLRFRLLAIFLAGIFLRAADFIHEVLRPSKSAALSFS